MSDVHSNAESTGKMLGGITGKGFMPGQSGNPGGRKKKFLTEVFEEMLEENLADPIERKAFKDATWKKLKSERVVSSMTLEKVLDRTEGKLTQPVDVSGTIDIGQILEKWRNAEEPDR